MRIGINALCYSRQRAGISNYAWHLISRLPRQAPQHDFVVFIPAGTTADFPKTGNIRYVSVPLAGILSRILAEQLLLPVFSLVYHLKLLHSVGNVCPKTWRVRNVLTVHDVYFVHQPKRFGLVKRTYLRCFVRRSVRRADSIITVTACTATDLARHFGVETAKTAIIHEGYSAPASPVAGGDSSLRAHNLPEKFFLFVGTIEPGKNLLRLVQAFERLDARYHLAIAGKWGWGCEDLAKYCTQPGLSTRVHFLGYVSDEQLSALYRNAIALIMPSEHEGFGLPLVEAMAHSCPICCSNTSCLPEIAGEAAVYFSPTEIDSIYQALSDVLSPAAQERLRQAGEARKSLFSWEKCVDETLAVYENRR